MRRFPSPDTPITPGTSTGITAQALVISRLTGVVSSVVVLPGGWTGVGLAADAGDALAEVDVWSQVGVCEVETGVDITDRHRRAPTVDCVGRGRLDLVHVPLPRCQRVGHRGRARVVDEAVIVEVRDQCGRCRNTLDPRVLDQVVT